MVTARSLHNTPPAKSLPLQSVETLQAFIEAPVENAEWVDGQIIEKGGMTVKHGVVQGRLSYLWTAYAESVQETGLVCVEAPCCTLKQVRRPDVAFITGDLLTKYGQPATFPESFPLIAEIISPTDFAEATFAKAQEYLESGCKEVWLVLPEVQHLLVMTREEHMWFMANEMVTARTTLKGFQVAVKDLVR